MLSRGQGAQSILCHFPVTTPRVYTLQASSMDKKWDKGETGQQAGVTCIYWVQKTNTRFMNPSVLEYP